MRIILGVLFGILSLGCQTVQTNRSPVETMGPGKDEKWALMSSGSLESVFSGIRTIGFARPQIVSTNDPMILPSEREQFETAIRASIRSYFVESGYEWVEEGTPQRTLDIAFVLVSEDGLEELEQLFGMMPGFPDAVSVERGILAVAISWPGRAEPVYRASIEGVGGPSWTLESRLSRIPEAVSMLFESAPLGPVIPAAEPAEDR